MHRLAGAVDAAIGIEIGIDRTRLRPAGDAAVAQIEGGAADFEKIEIAVLAVGHDRKRLVAAAAAHEPARDPGEPVGVAGHARQLAVVAGIEPHARRRERALPSASERTATTIASAPVYEVRPRSETSTQLVAGRSTSSGRRSAPLDDREIDAGTAVAEHVLQRDRGRDRGVALAGDRHLAFPDELAGPLDDLVDIPASRISSSVFRRRCSAPGCAR